MRPGHLFPRLWFSKGLRSRQLGGGLDGAVICARFGEVALRQGAWAQTLRAFSKPESVFFLFYYFFFLFLRMKAGESPVA